MLVVLAFSRGWRDEEDDDDGEEDDEGDEELGESVPGEVVVRGG